ncbi:uncharacterized protein B0H18DRAFT_898949 [Fomitopsis serialis]|uniref:uncharacterized protein n=1 Tax=Fomitopsis serialis TaxID=139415 RepID=UPI0020083C3C|nr:uncharacterized protein B0H18DRAFT_898949 [Neoantrodia serialis]KAH9906104.1 hypothetical protein B0H18DRAFT_898949 [Neoantrodia serialis]
MSPPSLPPLSQYADVIDISWRQTLRYDPRLGDEDEDQTAYGSYHGPHDTPPLRHVRIETPSWGPGGSQGRSSPTETEKLPQRHETRSFGHFMNTLLKTAVKYFPLDLAWIPANFSWPKIKPVIRSSVMAFISIIFMVLSPVEGVTGQATFLLLIAAFLDPPSDPLISVLERELILALFVTLGWAWSALGIFFAHLARDHTDYNATLTDVLSGQYIEAGPTVICAVWVFFGVTFFLFIKVKKGPGPYLIPSVFGAITIDISFVTAVLFPYPYYTISQTLVLPLVLHAGLCVVTSATIFPSTITAQYAGALARAIEPLEAALREHRAVLKLAPSSSEFPAAVQKIGGLVTKAEAGLGPAAAALRLVKNDIVWGRFAPADIGRMQEFGRRLVVRANGLGIFFTLIEPTRERFPVTPLPSRPSTPSMTPVMSRRQSFTHPGTPTLGPNSPGPRADPDSAGWADSKERGRLRHRNGRSKTNPNGSMSSLRLTISRHLHLRLRKPEHEEDSQNERLHFSLLHLAHNLSVPSATTPVGETAVAVFESQRYLALEATRLSHPDSPEATETFVYLLGLGCDELLGVCADAVGEARGWVAGARSGWFEGKSSAEQRRAERLGRMADVRYKVDSALSRFRKEYRHKVLDPYRSAFDPSHVGSPGVDATSEPPPHRYLFHCYVYQYHLIQFTTVVIEMIDAIMSLEENKKRPRLWGPFMPMNVKKVLLSWGGSQYDATVELEGNDDEDPDAIPGMQTDWDEDLGQPSRRDPDALPPHTPLEHIMSWFHTLLMGLTGGNMLFALKAGTLTVLLCIPNFLKHTAHFAYEERFVWGIFMGQLTLARFRGDTTFALFARLLCTFLGGVTGMVVWYIAAQKGIGNAYGYTAAVAFCMPFFYYGRLYWPGPPMSNIIFFVTACLVLGFSWQNAHFAAIFHFYGWALAWRRFVIVCAGVTAAFIFSLLPPSTTLRKYQRTMLSTTTAELGSIYCSIVSFANTRGRHEVNRGEIVQALIAIRMKLKRSVVLKTNIIYEFSLRGKWPAQRYQRILELQMQIAFLLSHLMSVVEHLDPAWSLAFLRRTRLLDADFQGDVLAVICMISTALRTGTPLPQVTPCPLVDRFMVYTHGLNIIRQEADDDYGLPRTMTIDTLENEQYLSFAVGVTTAFGIILRLDKLMVAAKELVGEQYHIHGIGIPAEARAFMETTPTEKIGKEH